MYYNKKSNMPDGRKGVPMKLVIPEYKTLELDTIFLDMNGTIAVDGVIPPSVKERLIALSEQFRIYVLTADTHGNAKAQCEGLPVILYCICRPHRTAAICGTRFSSPKTAIFMN